MITEEHALVESVVGNIPLISSGVIVKVDRFDESNVHNLVIQVVHRNLCRMIPGRARGIREDDVPFALGFAASHSNESGWIDAC